MSQKRDNIFTHLHPLEIKTLRACSQERPTYASALLSATGFSEDRLRMALEWLTQKALLTVVDETKELLAALTDTSAELCRKKLLELRLLDALTAQPVQSIVMLVAHIGEEAKEINIALANLKKAGCIEIQPGGMISRLTDAEPTEVLRRQQLIEAIGAAGVRSQADFDAASWEMIENN